MKEGVEEKKPKAKVFNGDEHDSDDEDHDELDSSKLAKRGKRGKDEFKFPIEPRIVAVVKKPRTYMNHSYRDFSAVPPELNHEEPSEITSMSFSQKVHHILSQDEHSKWISWMSHGRAFRIHIPKLFEQKVSPKYFGHSRYSSFLRQLNNYGFKHITQGKDRNCYYHEFMLRGLPHLCKYMPKPKDARRLIPDAENEPDFYKISKMYPLPDDPSFGKEQAKEPEDAPPQRDASGSKAVNASVASPEGSLKRRSADLLWRNSQAADAKRIREMQADPLMSLAASSPLNSPAQTLASVNWPIQTTNIASLDQQHALLAALAGASARNPSLADLYPSVNGAQHAQNLFNAFRHL